MIKICSSFWNLSSVGGSYELTSIFLFVHTSVCKTIFSGLMGLLLFSVGIRTWIRVQWTHQRKKSNFFGKILIVNRMEVNEAFLGQKLTLYFFLLDLFNIVPDDSCWWVGKSNSPVFLRTILSIPKTGYMIYILCLKSTLFNLIYFFWNFIWWQTLMRVKVNVLDFEEKNHSGINRSFLVPNQ